MGGRTAPYSWTPFVKPTMAIAAATVTAALGSRGAASGRLRRGGASATDAGGGTHGNPSLNPRTTHQHTSDL